MVKPGNGWISRSTADNVSRDGGIEWVGLAKLTVWPCHAGAMHRQAAPSEDIDDTKQDSTQDHVKNNGKS